MDYIEELRPQVHYTTRKNWINDPNGCFYFEEKYHLYYQYNPFTNNWGSMHWGHAESDDLLHWEEKQIALYPDEELGMAFSGSAIIDSENVSNLFPNSEGLIAYYTSHLELVNKEPLQQQCMAISYDNGDTWTPYKENPIIKNPGRKDFRDPKVLYHEASQSWIMVLSGGDEILFYRSKNLLSWQYISSFGKKKEFSDGVFECPDFFQVHMEHETSKWVLSTSYMNVSNFNIKPNLYFIGSFDGEVFTPDEHSHEPLNGDFGYDSYANQTWFGLPKKDQRTIWIGWANHWAYSNSTPTDPWRGVMSIPRELGLGVHEDNFYLTQNPIREFITLRNVKDSQKFHAVQHVDIALHPTHSHEVLLSNKNTANFSLSFTNDVGESVVVSYKGENHTIRVDRSKSGAKDFHPLYSVPMESKVKDDKETLEVRILLDRSIIEVFVNSGITVCTAQLFPLQKFTSLNFATDENDQENTVIYFPIESIWKQLNKNKEILVDFSK